MKPIGAAAFLLVLTVPVAVEIPDSSFFAGNDVYNWCQHDTVMVVCTENLSSGVVVMKSCAVEGTVLERVQIPPGKGRSSR
jgi:hypothetical protein